MLDVGAGTGLLALEARRRVGPSGRVVAVDVSQDALRECRRQAALDELVVPLHLVVGDALQLPFHDNCFDAVLTRSVLIYLTAKLTAVRELRRVLRPGGRASIFEPVNSASDGYAWNWGLDLSSLQPAHDRIVAYLREHWEHENAMLGFDERDLVGCFVEAGFASVRLSYEYRYDCDRRRPGEITASLRVRPNPTMLSYEEGARAILGDAADDHLLRLSRLMLSQPLTGVMAAAHITARRSS
ncbi:MAG: hypothetical protein A2148_00725 [Chloroflexi bacterium RBG_16_68_14]|nr:MAG: hypothetical protein A2148_00725 [Chloroflexi bacterium RBG_16_68_14]